ncbi:hypothetical protein [Streptomyces sp. NPDC049916]|uniref:hypothetical protein n=1 Tax=Streptomyces sp. NPDC049916 TaxID=3155156 RepID=UPI003437ACFB
MERDELAELLREEEEVVRLCRAALLGGADFAVWADPVARDRLARVYSRRLRTTAKTGQPTLGFAEAVERLASSKEPEVWLGHVDDRPAGGYYYQLFLAPGGRRLVACLAVRRSADTPGRQHGSDRPEVCPPAHPDTRAVRKPGGTPSMLHQECDVRVIAVSPWGLDVVLLDGTAGLIDNAKDPNWPDGDQEAAVGTMIRAVVLDDERDPVRMSALDSDRAIARSIREAAEG